MFQRDTSALGAKEFDVVVIGAGINGAAVAWDAALRGFSVALIEKSDFGGGASSGCFKTVHSGLRYLQHLDVKRLRESVVEQRILRIIAPHLVHPLPFLIPCYGYTKKGIPLLKVGMHVFELLATPRNKGVDEYHFLPSHQVLTQSQCLSIAPGLNKNNLKGGVVYYDSQMSNCDRLTLAVVRGAACAGATVVNYVEATGAEFSVENGVKRISAIKAKDLQNGRELSVKAKIVVNAAGPWLSKVLSNVVARPVAPKLFSKGIQIVLPQFINGFGIAIESEAKDEASVVSRGGRAFFVFPWRGRSLVGTSDELLVDDPENFKISAEDVRTLVHDVQTAYCSDKIRTDAVSFAFGGFRPVSKEYRVEDYETLKAKQLATTSRDDLIVDHANQAYSGFSEKIANAISVEGVKYTTFRNFGEKTVDVVARKLGASSRKSKTATHRLPGGEIESFQQYLDFQINSLKAQFPKEVVSFLVKEYGSELNDVIAVCNEHPEFASFVSGTQIPKGSVVYATRAEMAMKLSDVILRRTGIGTICYPGDTALTEVAGLMATELGWDSAEIAKQINEAKEQYSYLGLC